VVAVSGGAGLVHERGKEGTGLGAVSKVCHALGGRGSKKV